MRQIYKLILGLWQCPSGYYAGSGSGLCSACPAGKYLTSSSGQTETASCTSVSMCVHVCLCM